MVLLLLLQGGGVVSALHKISHHTPEQRVSSCDHASGEHAPERNDAPSPEQGDDECSICLGLSGLHLAPVADAPKVIAMPGFEADRFAPVCAVCLFRVNGEPPARAPPVC